MRRITKTRPHLKPNYDSETMRSGLQPALKARRTLIAGAIFVALLVGGTPTADAATSSGDTLVQTQRFCWWSNCY